MKIPGLIAVAAFSLSLSTAFAAGSEDFATGNMPEAAHGMDTNGDGMISKKEFMKYEAAQFDKMKNAKGLVAMDDMIGYLKGPSSGK